MLLFSPSGSYIGMRLVYFLALSALWTGLSAQTTRLKLGKTVERDISAGQIHSYTVRLKAQQYMRAVVTQPLRTAVVQLYSPDGTKVLEVDSRNFTRTSRIVWIAETAGPYSIRVSCEGHYEIKLEELRAAGAGDRERVEAERLFTQAASETRKFAYEAALSSYTQSLGFFRDVRDRAREGDSLNAIGAAYNSLSQSEKAIGYYEQALAIRREVKDRGGEGATLNSLGNAYLRLSQDEKAIGYYQQALVIRRELKDRQAEAGNLENLGTAYYHLSEFDKAIDYYEQALPIRREVKDRKGEGQTLNGLGNAYNLMSRNDKAIGYWEQSLAIAREVGNRVGEANTLNNLGNAYVDLSQYQKAIRYFEDALAIRRETKDRQGEGTTLGNLAIAYKRLNQYEKAIRGYEEALAIYREVKDRKGEGQILNNLGTAYQKQDQYQKAIPYFEQALAIARQIKNREDQGGTLDNLGVSYEQLGQHEKAISYFEQALAIARETKDRGSEGQTLGNLADTYLGLGRNGEAIATYTEALAIAREIKDRPSEADELSGLMETWQASGQPRLAIFYGKQAVNTVQSMRADIAGLGHDLQQSFLKGNEKPYHTLAEILIAQGRLGEAEQVLALLKEEEYFRYVRRDAAEGYSLNRRADLTPEEAEYERRYREIGDRLMAIGVEHGELLAAANRRTLTPEQSQRLVKLENDLASGNQAFEHVLADLTRHFSAKPELNAKVVEQLREEEGFMEDLRELPAGTVAIYTVAGEDKFYTILRTPDAQKAYEYPIKAADLNRKISEFRQAVQDPSLDPRPPAQEMYQILIAPMADDLRQAQAKTLMWELDGALRYVPIAALYDGNQYLIERYRVSVMTLASKARLKDRPDSAWSVAGFGVTKKHEDNPALPEVAAELEGVREILHGEIRLDEQFTEASMRATLLKHFPVVHIASHFRFQPGDQSNSFLLLGDGGHLSLAELQNLPNLFSGVQLLTLSACNTGLGDGTEVEGFGMLAQQKGAKAVVASLWSVADSSTSVLMTEFYRIRETSPGIPKLEALREVQLRLLHGEIHLADGVETHAGRSSEDYRHPFYWAPFFLMGNWL
jgi:CHAT domain-containing protein/tetratricopeptide (TPR) repeat protein